MARRLVVHGRVQGVFFRATTRDVATRLGVRGWVRNDPQGTVTAHVEGDDAAVDRLVAWIRDGGPQHARVTTLEVDEVADEGHEGFTVRH